MTATSRATEPAAHEAHLQDAHTHPTEKQYVVVALVLAAITALEVGLYYITSLPDRVLVAMLGVLAFVKFVGVALYFMHLKFDSRVFRRFFVAGLVLAFIVFGAALATMHVFSGGFPVLGTPT
jgi:cytochrome c oxidase subunit 4